MYIRSVNNFLILPAQAEHLITSSRTSDLDILALHTLGDHLALSLQHNAVLRLRKLVEVASIHTQEVLQLLLCDVVIGDDTTLNALLQRQQDVLDDKGLGEDTSRWLGVSIGTTLLGCPGMRGAVASTILS